MTKITKEELLKVARLSHVFLPENEIDGLIADIDNVLTYAARVGEIAADVEEETKKNVNVTREDVVIPTPPQPLLAQAPERIEDFFVVPMILESNE
jgi:aspartyl-tRNA(Asn)/glutamyl-tRNA(Gln) amidotransferase subunit C